jgi:hypothetical protein
MKLRHHVLGITVASRDEVRLICVGPPPTKIVQILHRMVVVVLESSILLGSCQSWSDKRVLVQDGGVLLGQGLPRNMAPRSFTGC